MYEFSFINPVYGLAYIGGLKLKTSKIKKNYDCD